MADYCKQCSEELLGGDFGDHKGLVEEGLYCRVLCEGCGITTVDHEGRCMFHGEGTSEECFKASLVKSGVEGG